MAVSETVLNTTLYNKIYLFNKTRFVWFFIRLNRFKVTPSLRFSLVLIFVIHCRLFETWIWCSLKIQQFSLKFDFRVIMIYLSILTEITSYRTIWQPLLPHTTCVFRVSFVCNLISAPFLSYLSKRIFAAFVEAKLGD